MKIKELIACMQECIEVNGSDDFDVVVCTPDGGHYSDIDTNVVDNFFYIEGYKNIGDLTPGKVSSSVSGELNGQTH